MKFLVGTVCCFLIFIWAEEVAAERKSLLGSEAKDGEFPYQVYLRSYFKDDKTIYMCGGSILNARTILTAGHCIYNRTMGRQKDSVYVIAGTNNPNEISRNSDYVKVRVTRIVCYPDYIQYGTNDIAILKLETPLQFSDRITTVELPASKLPDHGRLTVSGWGKTSPSSGSSSHLQYIYLQPKNLKECRRPNRRSDICANSDYGSTVCKGDSGGPAVGYDGRQYGVVSQTYGNCVAGITNVLTSVYYNLNWIKGNWY